MRGLAVLVFAGCYTATPAQGVPCDPAASNCPSGQRCVLGTEGYVCSTGDGITIDSATSTMIDAPLVQPDAMLAPIRKTYTATVAECIAPALPNPALCRQLNGDAQLVIDIRDSTTEEPWHSFIRFDLDAALEGRTATKVVLRLVVTNAANAPGPDGGTVFAVQPFTLASLSMTPPAKVGNMLATHAAAIDSGDTIDFELALPALIAKANQPVYLGLYPNDDNGVNYFNRDGASPPRLIVDAQ